MHTKAIRVIVVYRTIPAVTALMLAGMILAASAIAAVFRKVEETRAFGSVLMKSETGA